MRKQDYSYSLMMEGSGCRTKIRIQFIHHMVPACCWLRSVRWHSLLPMVFHPKKNLYSLRLMHHLVIDQNAFPHKEIHAAATCRPYGALITHVSFGYPPVAPTVLQFAAPHFSFGYPPVTPTVLQFAAPHFSLATHLSHLRCFNLRLLTFHLATHLSHLRCFNSRLL